MPKNPTSGSPQKIDVNNPAAMAAAGFGSPNQSFNPEQEIAASQSDAAMVENFNRINQVDTKAVVSTAAKGKKAGKVAKKNIAAPPASVPESAPIEEEDEEDLGEEGDSLELSNDPAERLRQVSEALKELDPKAPLPEELGQWKQMHGDVFILYMFDQGYVYRYLKRAEWIKMNLDESFQNMRQDQVEEYIFDRCVLWPKFSVIEKNKLPAGTVPSLAEQIRINSMFVDPNRLSQLTVKL